MDIYIMSGNKAAAKYIDGSFEILDKSLCPLYLLNTGNVEHWLEMRAIDCHRANSRLLKRALRLKEYDDINTVLSVNAVTITDNYWIKPANSSLTYEDVRFDNDSFSNLALTGNYNSFNRAMNSRQSKTPELTNTGSFEKCWKLINGEWWMYKKADHNQQFTEIFISRLSARLRMKTAVYERGEKCVKTKDFTRNASVNFEPAYSFMNDNDDYRAVYEGLMSLTPKAVPDYVKMIFMDTVTANPDRHTFNFGILRDIKNGAVIGLAPNFDNNMALISNGYPSSTARKNDAFVRLFNELTAYDASLKKYIPKLTEDDIRQTIADVGMRVRTNTVVEFIMNGYRQIL